MNQAQNVGDNFQDVLVQLNGILGIDSVLDLMPEEDDINELHKIPSGDDYDDRQSYATNMQQFQLLHQQISKSSQVLDVLEKSLTEFQAELDSLSQDMELLQKKSETHKQRLDIRKQVEDKLAPLIEALIVPPSIVQQIAEKEISPQWRVALKYVMRRKTEIDTLGGKIKIIPNNSSDDDSNSGTNEDSADDNADDENGGSADDRHVTEKRETPDNSEKNGIEVNFKAFQTAKEQIDLLLIKAVERVREYMISRIKALRTYGVNAQAVQVELLANQELYKFLFSQQKQLALDLRQAYLYTMRWYYEVNFNKYIRSLEKMSMYRVADARGFLVGSSDGDSVVRLAGSSKKSSHITTDYLNVGDRANIISSDDPTVLISHVAENSTRLHWAETGFRSLSMAVIDNATAEYQFISEFFQFEKREQPSGLFNIVFEPTYALGHAYTKFLVDSSPYDAYAILICIRLCKRFELELQHRKVPVVQDYFNLQLLNLWPKFQTIMDLHCESIRKATTRFSSYSGSTNGGANSSAGATSSSSASSTIVPHHTTQQFSTFLYGLLSLCESDGSESEPVATSINRLRNDFESFLTKLSGYLHGNSQNREKFLYNNYFLVSTIISDLQGRLVAEQQNHFKMLTEAYK